MSEMQQPWSLVGLTEAEYRRVVEILGREPNPTELHMFGVMWSEHCAYKHSKAALRRLPTRGEHVLQGPGENAGVVRIDDDLAVAFKLESHNHPSFVDPFNGAATGVGGILRDVFTMGARPVATLNSLRFGPLDEPKQRELLRGVVAGIGHYGNTVGVPCIGGEVYFDESYRGNCLVNAMCIGILRPDRIHRGIAAGPGNAIMVVGNPTGRDGIHAASLLASAEFSGSEAEAALPTVPVGDPFAEKMLMEACLELFETDAVVGIQDMGAAGLISSSSEMAARGGVGVELDVRKVPAREEGMEPWEFLLSESQERMLVCVKKGREAEVEAICRKWGVGCAVIGRVTDDGMVRVLDDGRVVAEVPARALAEAPVYHPAKAEPAYLAELRAFDWSRLPEPEDWNETLLRLLGSPNIGARAWIYEQFDHMVQAGTVLGPGGDAGVIRLGAAVAPGAHGLTRQPPGEGLPGRSGQAGPPKGIAASVDCNGRYVYLNPRRGTAIAVAEAARNCVVTGARPVAITNNCNFGNPEKPEIFWTFDEAITGMAEACEALGTPVTGGNVSFYNETSGEAIHPTPTIGMIAVHENLDRLTTPGFKQVGDVILLLGETRDELGGSEYARLIHGVLAGDAPALDLAFEKRLQDVVLRAIHEGLVTAAHDVAEGGLAVALAEMAIAAAEPSLGCQVSIFLGEGRVDGQLFGESQSRILVTATREQVGRLQALLMVEQIPFRVLGDVTADGRFRLAALAPGSGSAHVYRRQELIDLPVADLVRAHKEAIPRWMDA
ncbi:phosphoribosylformylglycinamidine synthetase [Symbiobacterium thermophilum IAM 14863]|uniref:Phosphoribosylformylglycinamidine synthase subunit PurL n=4 Tax=Symbiobacterium thermophilum TaxID=2734 RepID=PURL_SYMTH|nr:RecName: Full=Phosphoribosylformylglycinamidine synthase subunit PurL; Short=FGAM synthase; AltName: Full=Formylglycinamide ribonucleotide amidotransferase subunit II; Short=FGAR amidotransferase II; Short=FGAR-AT II; AltName: Full=Glutamine amidotransferase PurL; AltName: Full=Phosphoribosylformylglycinamidine synthase subunit II [Symbiobacterium thermophilum IAM 14863]BAD41840.1 phosphoribosylformylglycinamidine synthetase [Symbiobacterium thermophilum IAM 14863]